ncbi:GNAT family N-acetyltransferase [Phaeocystidibacter luteus]|uniref:GNAT family N-acetyltransferase n=1 Tax=Phaeocystidibacter luteus TaxID=911197 RepID=A0A6N6RK35_9FLAO|nr:GNAT family N-acetyltransferase [Phaeocystidibacter luteus]KAB2808671.1 GNAT family N-acetyltransferase [Phaeocystidibacter luteus]
MSIRIREIEPSDNAAVAKMIRGVFEEFDAERCGTVYSDPTTDNLYEVFRNPKSVYFVAEEDGQIVGACGIYPTNGLPEGYAELVKYYLPAKARGKGIGRELMERSTAAALKMGYTHLYLESLPEFSKAVSIYEKQGFKPLEKPLSTEHPGCNLWFLKKL